MAQRTYDDEDWLYPIGSEDDVTKKCLAKDYFQDKDEGWEALARTQVYLSKTKLKLQVGT